MHSICFTPVVMYKFKFYFQSLLNRNATYGVWLSTTSVTVCLFIVFMVYDGISLAS